MTQRRRKSRRRRIIIPALPTRSPKSFAIRWAGIFEPEGDTADPWTSAAEAALEALGESLSPAFAGLCTLTGVIILAAVCKCLNINVADGEQAKAFSYLVRAVLAAYRA